MANGGSCSIRNTGSGSPPKSTNGRRASRCPSLCVYVFYQNTVTVIGVGGGVRRGHPESQAARQAGLAARAALDLVPAHDRHLADRVAGARARTYDRAVRWTPNVERWEIARTARSRARGERRTTCARGHAAARRRGCWPTTPTRRSARGPPPDRPVRPRHRRLPQRAALEPERPTLIDAQIQLVRGDGTCSTSRRATPRCALNVQGDRFVLNGRPYLLRMVLDQGYWPETGLTAPDDEALRRDVELAKAMGFNGVRKHQKIEDPRYLYWADRLGLLVWEEMPSAYRFTRTRSSARDREWTEAIERDYSHPCIVAWVPFNESWGVPDLPDTAPAQRHYVQALYHLTKTLDPTRPVIGNDGWESSGHRHHRHPRLRRRPERIRQRYGSEDQPASRCSPGAAGRAHAHAGRLRPPRPADHADGFCYTQFADAFQETNGLLYGDRRRCRSRRSPELRASRAPTSPGACGVALQPSSSGATSPR